MMRIGITGVILGCALASASCYTYAPASLGSVQPGTSVRFQLTPQGSGHVPAVPGVEMSGEVSQVIGEEVLLSLRAPSLGTRTGGGVTRSIRLGPGDVADLRVSHLDRSRTAAFVAAVGALVGISFYFVHVRDRGGSGPDRPGGGGDFVLIPFDP